MNDVNVTLPTLPAAASEHEYRLHRAALQWSLQEPIIINSAEDIHSRQKWAPDFRPYNHQVENLMRFCRRLPVVLLADDVGLGKTISAGLILSELMVRSRVKRVLIICPAILGPQWKQELESKFRISAVFVTGSGFRQKIHDPHCTAVITTYDSARSSLEEVSQDHFDMLILDEAHKLRNLFGAGKPPKMAIAIHEALQNRLFRFCLMLTATPMQNRLWDIYSLVSLLTTVQNHANPLGSPEIFRRRFIAGSDGRKALPENVGELRAIVSQYLFRTRRQDARLPFPDRRVLNPHVDSIQADARFLNILRPILQEASPLQQISLLQALFSSPRALAAQMRNMKVTGLLDAGSTLSEVEDLARRHPLNGKAIILANLIQELAENNPNWRLVVFTMRRETQNAIGDMLQAMKVSYGFIRGASAEENQRVMDSYRGNADGTPKLNVIISTDAGAEGVNLQAGNVLVNYDLPWNPMILEQRIGRVQRLGSSHAFVQVINLAVSGSIEKRVLARLLEKLLVISQAIGEIEAILDEAGLDDDDGQSTSFEQEIRELVMNSLLGQDQEKQLRMREQSIQEAAEKLQEHRSEIDDMLGTDQSSEDLRPPKLERKVPELAVRQFVLEAVKQEGAELREIGPDVFELRWVGKAPERITFETTRQVNVDGQAVFQGIRTWVCAPGQPYFERLVQRWLSRSASHVRDATKFHSDTPYSVCREYLSLFPDVTFKDAALSQVEVQIAGEMLVRAQAYNGLDRFEQLVPVKLSGQAAPAAARKTIELCTQGFSTTNASLSSDEVASAVKGDTQLLHFARFYSDRTRHELAKATTAEQQRRIRADFSPMLSCEAVALWGERIARMRAMVHAEVDAHAYTIELMLLPALDAIEHPPATGLCCISRTSYPADWLAKCSVSGKMALRHRLAKSEVSGELALAVHTKTCALTGKKAIEREMVRSEVSGRWVLCEHAARSAVSYISAAEDELARCEITQARALPSELLTSDYSGRRFRADQAAKSDISKRQVHLSELHLCPNSGQSGCPDEMMRCEESGEYLIPSELSECQLTNKKVNRRLLETCSITGTIAFHTYLVTDCITNKRILRNKAIQSSITNHWCAQDRAERCQWHSLLFPCSEIDTCRHTGLRVHKSLLEDGSVRNLHMVLRGTAQMQPAPEYVHQFCKTSALPAFSKLDEIRIFQPDIKGPAVIFGRQKTWGSILGFSTYFTAFVFDGHHHTNLGDAVVLKSSAGRLVPVKD